jgi:hypothetical protein
MADIKVLMVSDGSRFTFGPAQPAGPTALEDDNYFALTTLVGALRNSAVPTIQVDTAHRRGATTGGDPDVSLGLTYPGNFTFTSIDLSQYDVIWLIGDEGYNVGVLGPTDSEITDAEKAALFTFMQNGGGLFAVGDHDGIGGYLCGKLPRVRTMRKWYEWDHVFTDPGTGQVFMPNWAGDGDGTRPGYPGHTDRFDTLQPDSADGNWYFYDQADPLPQTLMTAAGAPLTTSAGVHTILRGSDGAIIANFPDHMHEGEATDFSTLSATTTPFSPNGSSGSPSTLSFVDSGGHTVTYPEFPAIGTFQPAPQVIVYGQDTGHPTITGTFTYPATNSKRRGLVSAYDGRAVGIGRVVTGSTFHHYLDKNLIGDPHTESTTAGVGPTNSQLGLTTPVLNGIRDYYVNVVTWLARKNATFNFWILKSTYGADEVQHVTGPGGRFTNAFYLVLEGFAPSVVGATPMVNPTGPLVMAGATFHIGTPIPELLGMPDRVQRILIPVDVLSIPASAFPASGTRELALQATISFPGNTFGAEGLFELTAGNDPYFVNVDPGNPNDPWYLSQDLRVFQVVPSSGSIPFGLPWPTGANAPYTFIQNVISHLNSTMATPPSDPFTVLNESSDLTEDSSVNFMTPLAQLIYPFAIARVRLKGTSGTSISDLKVFFRIFNTLTSDTDFDQNTTFPSTLDASGLPDKPQGGVAGTTFPLFASPGGGGDYDPGFNDQNLTLSSSTETYAYFGCYIDVFTNPAITLIGDHHCLVAQIAYDGAPIVATNGITLSPENSDKLAQRNIEVTAIGNPSGPAGHRAPQTFDLRPSVRTPARVGTPLGYPDELMIDWGKIPVGSRATIFWPQAAAADVVRLAMLLYTTENLQIADEHTIQCTVTSRFSFVPIPFGTGGNFSGLFTVELPLGVRYGQKYDVVVRRVSTRQGRDVKLEAAATKRNFTRDWRYIVGSFQVTIPVTLEDELLWPEENKLAIMKWRLGRTPASDRWYRVLKRYVDLIAARVDAFGGNAFGIQPSPTGVPAPKGGGGHGRGHGELVERTGKVCEVLYDCFGDFEGFVLETCSERFAFASSEKGIGEVVLRACRERLLLTVVAERGHRHEVRKLIVRA